jgi:hypothetical protein
MGAFTEADLFDKSYVIRWIWLTAVIAGIFTIVFVQAPIHIATGPLSTVSLATIWNVASLYLAISAILASPAIFPKKGMYKRYIAFFNGLLLAAFILNAAPSNAAIMNGEKITNDWVYIAIRLAVGLVIGECLAFVLWRALKYFPMLLIALSLIFSAMDYIKTVPDKKASDSNESVSAYASTFSTNKNVIVIVLDMFQGSAAQEHLEMFPEFVDKFDGFTLFSRAFTTFNFTFFSRGTILSGNVYSTDDMDAYANETASIKDSFLTDLSADGYAVSSLGYDTQGVTKSVGSFNWYRHEDVAMQDYGTLFAASVARLSGAWISNPWDNTGGDTLEAIESNNKLDTISMTEILRDNFTLSEENRALFMWWHILHVPVQLDLEGSMLPEIHTGEPEYHSNEIYLTLSKLAELFQRLKDSGIYDKSLIILASDHGSALESSPEHIGKFDDLAGFNNNYGNYRKANFYNTALFVKPPYASGKLEMTMDPAWSGDVRAIIDYYSTHFEYADPKAAEASIRAANPDVPVMYSNVDPFRVVLSSKETHKFIVVQNLHQIPDELLKLTGIIDDSERW